VKPCCLLFWYTRFKRIVLETYGSGNAPTEDWFMALLVKAINNGLHVVNVTMFRRKRKWVSMKRVQA
jgi:L-asparaginase/Glu-tRNA(Gln) amidotransferase subunit D